MVFSVKDTIEEQKANGELEPFEFEDKHGNMQQLPNMKVFDADIGEQIVALMETDVQAALLLLAGGDEGAAEAIATTPLGAIPKFMAAYQEHCAMGELLASSGSSESMVRPSKPILPASSGRKAPRARKR